MKDWPYFYIKQTLQIGVPFLKYKGYGVYREIFVFWLENKKCGVILTCIESKSRYVPDLLADHEVIQRNDNLQCALEQVNEKFSKKLAVGPCLLKDRKWSMSRGKLTQNYFSWDGFLKVN